MENLGGRARIAGDQEVAIQKDRRDTGARKEIIQVVVRGRQPSILNCKSVLSVTNSSLELCSSSFELCSSSFVDLLSVFADRQSLIRFLGSMHEATGEPYFFHPKHERHSEAEYARLHSVLQEYYRAKRHKLFVRHLAKRKPLRDSLSTHHSGSERRGSGAEKRIYGWPVAILVWTAMQKDGVL